MTGYPSGRNCARRSPCLASIVIDPDSRLTQLGLLPICPEEDYYFFESRSYGADGDDALSAPAQSAGLRKRSASTDARAYISTGLDAAEFATTVSFGVGENPSKRVADPFEEELLRRLPRPILIDKGAGGEEAERVERAVAKRRRRGHRDVGWLLRGICRAHPTQPPVRRLRLGRRARRRRLRRSDDQHLRGRRLRAHVPALASNRRRQDRDHSPRKNETRRVARYF